MRKPPPRARRLGPAIAWTPTDDPYYLLAGMLNGSKGLPALSVTQWALLELRSKMKTVQSTLPYGLLAGELCVSPERNAQYLFLDEVTPARNELTEVDLKSQLEAELRSLASDAESRGKIPIGWYVGGIGEDLQLDGEDLSLHREVFPEPWQLVLLHDDTAGDERGAFLRYARASKHLYAIPFFELLPDPSRANATKRRTALHWVNYRPDAPVSRLVETDGTLTRGTSRGSQARSKNIASWISSWRQSVARFSPPWGGASLPDDSAPSSLAVQPSTEPASRPARAVNVATPPRAAVVQSPVVAVEAVRSAEVNSTLVPQESLEGVFVFINGELVGYSADVHREPPKHSRVARRRLLLVVLIVVCVALAIVALRASTKS